jgi:hypothetical protein
MRSAMSAVQRSRRSSPTSASRSTATFDPGAPRGCAKRRPSRAARASSCWSSASSGRAAAVRVARSA